MKGFLDNFYNIDTLRGTLVSGQAYQANWNLAVTASATAAVACIGTWATDFRADLPKVDGPAARVAITTLTMTRENDISLQMEDGHV